MAHTMLKRHPPTSAPSRVSSPNGERTEPWLSMPQSASSLDGFRQWTRSDGFPEKGKVAWLGGAILIDMSPERFTTHGFVKAEICRVIGNLVVEGDLGHYAIDRARFVNVEAQVSNEPDAMFVSWKTHDSGRARLVRTADEEDFIELEGSPDWVLEVVSKSSEGKDTVDLVERYHRAGVREYWLADARGDEVLFTILHHLPGGYRPAAKRGGWQKSRVFGHHFRLVRTLRRGLARFRLEVK